MKMLELLATVALVVLVMLRQVPLAWMVKLALQTVQLVVLLQVVQLDGQVMQVGTVGRK